MRSCIMNIYIAIINLTVIPCIASLKYMHLLPGASETGPTVRGLGAPIEGWLGRWLHNKTDEVELQRLVPTRFIGKSGCSARSMAMDSPSVNARSTFNLRKRTRAVTTTVSGRYGLTATHRLRLSISLPSYVWLAVKQRYLPCNEVGGVAMLHTA